MEYDRNYYEGIGINSNDMDPFIQVTVSVNDTIDGSKLDTEAEIWHRSAVFRTLLGAASTVTLVAIGLIIWRVVIRHNERMLQDFERSRKEKFDRMLTVYNSIRTREQSGENKAPSVEVDSCDSLSSLQPSIDVLDWPSVNSCLSAMDSDTYFTVPKSNTSQPVAGRDLYLPVKGNSTVATILMGDQDHFGSTKTSVASRATSHGNECLDHEHCIKVHDTRLKTYDFEAGRQRMSSFRAPIQKQPIRQTQTYPLSLDEVVPCPRNKTEMHRAVDKYSAPRRGSSSDIDLDCLVPAPSDSPLAVGGIIKLNENVFLCTPPVSGLLRTNGRAM